jgi:hypothetical protein
MKLIYTSNYIRSNVYACVAVEQNAATCIFPEDIPNRLRCVCRSVTPDIRRSTRAKKNHPTIRFEAKKDPPAIRFEAKLISAAVENLPLIRLEWRGLESLNWPSGGTACTTSFHPPLITT